MDTLSHTNHWESFSGQLQLHLLGGILSAFIFLFIVLFFFKPKIRIAKFLCKPKDSEFYIFKLVNVSFFSAHDLHVELYKIRRIPMGGGQFNNEYEKLTLLNSQISHIPQRPMFWKKNKDHPHCITVRSKENLNEILKQDTNAISLKVSLKHGLTGLHGVFEREYATEPDIQAGRFKPGTKFGII
jgi:hypothetical protein